MLLNHLIQPPRGIWILQTFCFWCNGRGKSFPTRNVVCSSMNSSSLAHFLSKSKKNKNLENVFVDRKIRLWMDSSLSNSISDSWYNSFAIVYYFLWKSLDVVEIIESRLTSAHIRNQKWENHTKWTLKSNENIGFGRISKNAFVI